MSKIGHESNLLIDVTGPRQKKGAEWIPVPSDKAKDVV